MSISDAPREGRTFLTEKYRTSVSIKEVALRETSYEIEEQKFDYDFDFDYDQAERRKSQITLFQRRKERELLKTISNPIEIEPAYYDNIPFKPGLALWPYLAVCDRNRKKQKVQMDGNSTLPKDENNASLNLPIPCTLIFEGGNKNYFQYSCKQNAVVRKRLPKDWATWIHAEWLRESKINFPDVSDPIVAVMKTSDYGKPCSQRTIAMTSSAFKRCLETPPENALFQRYIKSKGTKASVYRAVWHKNKHRVVYNIISRTTFNEGNMLIERKQSEETLGRRSSSRNWPAIINKKNFADDEKSQTENFCASSSCIASIKVFKLAPNALNDLESACLRVVRHLKHSISRRFGLINFDIEDLVCDFIKTDEKKWCILNVKAIKLSERACLEAAEFMKALNYVKAEKGDYFDEEQEIASIRLKRKARKGELTNVNRERPTSPLQKPQETNYFNLSQCKLCKKWCDNVKMKHDISSQEKDESESPKKEIDCSYMNSTDFWMTETMVKRLKSQLTLRGQRVSAFEQSEGKSVDTKAQGEDFRVCGLCYEVWRCNRTCISNAFKLAKVILPQSNKQPYLPGHPGYGSTPGSFVKYSPQCNRKATNLNTITARSILSAEAAKASRFDPKGSKKSQSSRGDAAMTNSFEESRQFRIALFFQDISEEESDLSQTQNQNMSFKYKVNSSGSYQSFSSKKNSIKQARVHYILAKKSSMQSFFLKKHVFVHATINEQAYTGSLFFTKFLSGISEHNFHSFQNLRVHLYESSVSPDDTNITGVVNKLTINVGVGVIMDDVYLSQLDPHMPFTFLDGVYYFPEEYFDMRLIPQDWVKRMIKTEVAVERRRAIVLEQESNNQKGKLGIPNWSNQNRETINCPSKLEESLWWQKVEEIFLAVAEQDKNLRVPISKLLAAIIQTAMKQSSKSLEHDEEEEEMDWIGLVTLIARTEPGSHNPENSCSGIFSNENSDVNLQDFKKLLKSRMKGYFSPGNETETTQEDSNTLASGGASYIFAIGALSPESRADAVKRRRKRYQLFADLFKSIDFDRSGKIDIAELRSYLRQRKCDFSLRPPIDVLQRKFEEWNLEEAHYYFCSWLSDSDRCSRKFDQYDNDASGHLTWEELTHMFIEAFQPVAQDELSFATSKVISECVLHGQTQFYMIDLQCVKCEQEVFEPPVDASENEENSNIVEKERQLFMQKIGKTLLRNSFIEKQNTEKTVGGEDERNKESQKNTNILTQNDTYFRLNEDIEEKSKPQETGNLEELHDCSVVVTSNKHKLLSGSSLAVTPAEQTESLWENKSIEQPLGVASTTQIQFKTKIAISRNGEEEPIKKKKKKNNRAANVKLREKKHCYSFKKESCHKLEKKSKLEFQKHLNRLQNIPVLEEKGVSKTRSLKRGKRRQKKIKQLKEAKKKCSTVHARDDMPEGLTSFSICEARVEDEEEESIDSNSKSAQAEALRDGKLSAKTEQRQINSAETAVNRYAEIETEAVKEAIFVYMKHGNVSKARAILRASALSVSFFHRGMTPLHVAAEKGKIEMVRFLLSIGADPLAKDAKGKTPVQSAIVNGHKHLISTFTNFSY